MCATKSKLESVDQVTELDCAEFYLQLSTTKQHAVAVYILDRPNPF